MTGLTPEARDRVERYVRMARASLRGSAVDSTEIEADLRAHIGDALTALPSPASAAAVDTVLDRLGHPHQWADAAGLPVWRRIINTLMAGPEDWRLAYLSFGFLVLGLVTLPFGGVVLIAGAYFLARANIAFLTERDVPVGVRGWLLYPALAAATAPVILVPLIAPVVASASWGIDDAGFLRLASVWPGSMSMLTEWRITGGFLALVVGTSWMIVATVGVAAWRVLRVLFIPFPFAFRRSHLWWLFGAGAMLAVAGAAVLWVRL